MNEQQFKEIIQSIPKAIAPHYAGDRELLNVELYFICKKISDLGKVKLIFESGVRKGRSTAIISAFAQTIGAKVVSCCSQKNDHVKAVDNHFKNLTMIYGRGEENLPKFNPCVVVSDGPKANTAYGVKLLETAAKKPSVGLLFQHDVHKEPDGGNFRRVADANGKTHGMIPKEFLAAHRGLCKKPCNSQVLGYWE